MSYGFNHSGVYTSDYMDTEEPDEFLECVCGHPADDHWTDDDSGKDSCCFVNNDGSLCCCDDFTHRDEPDFTMPPTVIVVCEICQRNFETIDEGKDLTETKCGCHLNGMEIEPPF